MITTGLLVAMSVLGPMQVGSQLDVKEVLDRWAAGARLIESYDLFLEFTEESLISKEARGHAVRLIDAGESPFVRTFRSHIVRDGSKRYGEFLMDEEGRPGRKFWFDGTTFTGGSLVQNHYDLQPGYLMFSVSQGEDYETLYRSVLGGNDFFTLARERNARLLPREGNLYVVDVPMADQPGSLWEMSWTVWLDPARNFLPTRLTDAVTKFGRRMQDTDVTIELAEVVPGVWAPVAARTLVYNKDPQQKIFGKHMGTHQVRVDRERSRFNVPIPDSRFVARIPNGASVADRIRNVVYTQGASDPDAYLADLARQGKQAAADLPRVGRPGKMMTVLPDRASYWSRGWVGAAGGVAALVVVGFGIAVGRSRGRAA